MKILEQVARGSRLGWRSFLVLWNDKTLIVFPLVSFSATVITILLLYVAAGPDKYQMVFRTVVNDRGVQLIVWGYYEVVAIAYFTLCFVTIFSNVALAGCTHLSMEVRDSKFLDGVKIAARLVHWITIWTFIASTVGPLLSLLDYFRFSSRWVRKILGATWSIMTYFVVPILVLEKTNIFSALRGSARLTTETWGEMRAHAGFGYFLAILNLPQLLIAALYYTVNPHFQFLVLLLAFIYFYLSLVVYQTSKAITAVVLYKYAKTGAAPEGFEGELLDSVFGVSRSQDESEVPEPNPSPASDTGAPAPRDDVT